MATAGSALSTRFWLWCSVGLVAVLLAFVTLLPTPFGGDQALWVVFARAIDHGAVLYRDVWDVKQPGIFAFYLIAGRLFGFDELGVHTLDLILWVGFALLLAVALRGQITRPWLAALAPAAMVAIYAMVADATEVTQVENVVGPFVFGVAWFAIDPKRWGATASFLSGLLAGIVLVFKLIFGPIVATLWIVAIVLRRRRGEGWRPLFTRFVVPAAAGCAVPLALMAWYLVVNDLVDIARFTFFEYPPQEAALDPRPVGRLLRSLLGYLVPLAAPVALAAYRLFAGNRSRGRDLSIMMATWVAGSIVVFLLEPWWSYYLYLGFVPLLVLACQGLDDALDRFPARTVAGVAGLLLLPALTMGGIRAATEIPPLLSGEGVTGLRRAGHTPYAESMDDLAVVPPLAAERVYVIGNPLILYLGGAEQAIPINGWSAEYWTDELWGRVQADLAADPPRYLYLSDEGTALISERAPALMRMVGADYRQVAEGARGTWYAPADSG